MIVYSKSELGERLLRILTVCDLVQSHSFGRSMVSNGNGREKEINNRLTGVRKTASGRLRRSRLQLHNKLNAHREKIGRFMCGA